MSDHRKVLIPKRKNERSNSAVVPQSISDNNIKRGVKRQLPPSDTPRKNIANDRLKRLRTSLSEQAASPATNLSPLLKLPPNKHVDRALHPRKRPSNSPGSQNATEVKKPCGSKLKEFKFEEFPTVLNCNVGSRTFHFGEAEPSKLPSTNDEMEWSSNEVESTSQYQKSFVDNKRDCDSTSSRNFYIVADTNIFIGDLQLIKTIVEMKDSGPYKPIIYVPWIVTEELDYIKEDRCKDGLNWKAREAIKFIHKCQETKNERLIGQSYEEVLEQPSSGNSQDNKIIASAIMVLSKYQHMAVLTNDVNLRNKCYFSNIPTYSSDKIIAAISSQLNEPKSELILKKMTSLCSNVIADCASKAYGAAYSKMEAFRSAPKTIQDCIKLFRRYWSPVFQEILMKQFKKAIEDFSHFLDEHRDIRNDSTKLNDLVQHCVRICLFLKDVDHVKNSVSNTVRELNLIKDS